MRSFFSNNTNPEIFHNLYLGYTVLCFIFYFSSSLDIHPLSLPTGHENTEPSDKRHYNILNYRSEREFEL